MKLKIATWLFATKLHDIDENRRKTKDLSFLSYPWPQRKRFVSNSYEKVIRWNKVCFWWTLRNILFTAVGSYCDSSNIRKKKTCIRYYFSWGLFSWIWKKKNMNFKMPYIYLLQIHKKNKSNKGQTRRAKTQQINHNETDQKRRGTLLISILKHY